MPNQTIFHETFRPTIWRIAFFACLAALALAIAAQVWWVMSSRPGDGLGGIIFLFALLTLFASSGYKSQSVTVDQDGLRIMTGKRVAYRFTYDQIRRAVPVSVRGRTVRIKTHAHRVPPTKTTVMTEHGQWVLAMTPLLTFVRDPLFMPESFPDIAGPALHFTDDSRPVFVNSKHPTELQTAVDALVARRKAEGLPDVTGPITEHGLAAHQRIVKKYKGKNIDVSSI